MIQGAPMRGGGFRALESKLQEEIYMDKMTDAKIRAWLQQNDPSVLDAYNHYLEGALAVLGPPSADTTTAPQSLRHWLETHHSEILDKIALS